MTDIHSCSYFCNRPECIKSQRDELRSRLAQPEQQPVAWMKASDIEVSISLFEEDGYVPLYTAPPQRKPDYKEFMEWASSKGYDTAYAINSDNGKYIPLNPMTADLWKAWQAGYGIKGEA